ncbi:MAG: MBL fold metallo-hydrolase [Anaerolineae bacterium]|nr:MBL fold metallo-hydrolase [Anaerolineae bacterium]
MALEIITLTLGMVQTNCYIVGDTDSAAAVVIDPADDAPAILAAAAARGWTIRQIVATHTHFDHVLAAEALQRETGAPLLIHPEAQQELDTLQVTGRLFGLELPPPPEPDGFIREGERVEQGAIVLEVRFTPGHAPGHISLVLRSEQVVFCGDCLFAGSVGRTDLPGGDYDTLIESIEQKLLPLGDTFRVAAGHGPWTTIGRERATNPFLNR